MRKKRNTRSMVFRAITLIVLLVIDVALGVVILGVREDKKKIFHPVDYLQTFTSPNAFEAIRTDLNTIIEKGGIDGAIGLSRIAIEQKRIDMAQCHMLLHLIGHASYIYYKGDFSRMVSEKNILCGSGPQHGSEAQIVLSSHDVKGDLIRFCRAVREVFPKWECYHGAGHAFLGKTHDIQQSLASCEDLAHNHLQVNVTDCYRGVFSEYASLSVGLETDTGLPIPHGPIFPLDVDHPLALCMTLPLHYQQWCASQMGRLHGGLQNESTFLYCANTRFPADVRRECVRINAAVLAQHMMSAQDTLSPAPSYIQTLSEELQYAYIDGFDEEFDAFSTSGLTRRWTAFCSSFPRATTQAYCAKRFQTQDSRLHDL